MVHGEYGTWDLSLHGRSNELKTLNLWNLEEWRVIHLEDLSRFGIEDEI